MKQVVVIGAGASGLAAAINIARRDNKVIVLERNSNAGKKLLLTGNGKCNLGNTNQGISHYNSSNFLYKDLVKEENIEKANQFIDSLGFIVKEKNGYLYPNSNQASTVLDYLLLECKRNNVEIKYNFFVSNIKYEDGFLISGPEVIKCDYLVLACGSKAYSKTGSDGIGYQLAQSLGHSIVPVKPALVSLISKEYFLQNWSGVRQDVEVSLLVDSEKVKSEEGEIQLTDYGVSGICIMQLSNLVIKALDKNQDVNLQINFLSGYDNAKFLSKINQKPNRSLIEIVSGIVNKKLAHVILELGKYKESKMWKDLNDNEQQALINSILAFDLKVTGYNGFENAQTVSGGIPLTEIDLKTMESNIIPRLFFTGEIVDCHGACGGYNLTLAWLTACLVGDYFD